MKLNFLSGIKDRIVSGVATMLISPKTIIRPIGKIDPRYSAYRSIQYPFYERAYFLRIQKLIDDLSTGKITKEQYEELSKAENKAFSELTKKLGERYQQNF